MSPIFMRRITSSVRSDTMTRTPSPLRCSSRSRLFVATTSEWSDLPFCKYALVEFAHIDQHFCRRPARLHQRDSLSSRPRYSRNRQLQSSGPCSSNKGLFLFERPDGQHRDWWWFSMCDPCAADSNVNSRVCIEEICG